MRAGDAHKLPAGGALAVDRDGFAAAVQDALQAEMLVEIRREAVPALPDASVGHVIVATGPLTSPELAQSIRRATGEDALAFFDAIAPIVHRDSIDFEVAGCSPATTSPARPAPAPTTSTVRWTRSIPRVRRGAGRRRQARVQGVGDLDPLLRGLSADRWRNGADTLLLADEPGW